MTAAGTVPLPAVPGETPGGRTGSPGAAGQWEYSAGGVVFQEGKVLLIQVQNLKGEKIWTFPKGHIEKGERAREAALREVEEETGYRCQILKPLNTARYRFYRQKEMVNKRVEWFLMKVGWKTSDHDATEILSTRWVSLRNAPKLLRYPSDLKLLEQMQ